MAPPWSKQRAIHCQRTCEFAVGSSCSGNARHGIEKTSRGMTWPASAANPFCTICNLHALEYTRPRLSHIQTDRRPYDLGIVIRNLTGREPPRIADLAGSASPVGVRRMEASRAPVEIEMDGGVMLDGSLLESPGRTTGRGRGRVRRWGPPHCSARAASASSLASSRIRRLNAAWPGNGASPAMLHLLSMADGKPRTFAGCSGGGASGGGGRRPPTAPAVAERLVSSSRAPLDIG